MRTKMALRVLALIVAGLASIAGPATVLYSNVALTNTWAMSTSLDWLSMNYDKYSGTIRAVAFDFM